MSDNPDRSWEAKRVDDDVLVDLNYPRSEGHAKAIQVGLSCVRAADSLRISYDFDRDGWVIQQERVKKGEFGEPIEGDWEEVHFAQAWALEK